MRRGFQGFALLTCLFVLASQAAVAQSDEIWRGDAGWLPLAAARLNTGELGVGDVVAEVELARTRTGRVASDIVLSNERHGALTIPAETLVVANRQTYVTMGGGQPARTSYGGIEWCTAVETQRICVARASGIERLLEPRGSTRPPSFTYTEYAAPGRLSGRVWSGEAPSIREERIELEARIRKQIIVREIGSAGILFTLRTIRNGEATDAVFPESITYGTRVYDSRTFSGVAFQVRRVSRRRIMIEAVNIPGEPTAPLD